MCVRDVEQQALVTVHMATEGYDLVGIDCVVMARVTDSELQFVQQMGRGLRRDPQAPDKACIFFNLVLLLLLGLFLVCFWWLSDVVYVRFLYLGNVVCRRRSSRCWILRSICGGAGNGCGLSYPRRLSLDR